MYQTIGTWAYIDGTKGKYSKKIADPSVRYGRNAINNLKGYYKDLHQKPVEFPDMKNFTSLSEEEQNKRLKQLDKATKSLKVTPMHYQCQYMPADYIDKLALMGAAYEKMGKKTCISVQEMMKNLQKEIPLGTDYPSLRFNVHSMDVNKDGAIDLSECATGILIADSLDEDGKTITPDNIDGTISDDGRNAFLFFHINSDIRSTVQAYRAIHNSMELDEAQEIFLMNRDNLK